MFDKLPKRIQELARQVFELFRSDPTARALEHRPLKDTRKGRHKTGSFRVAVTYRYRAIYVPDLTTNTNVWYWIGSHEDYNNFVGKI